MTYLSSEELTAIEEEITRTHPSTSSFIMSLDQASALVAELISRRGLEKVSSPKSQQIDLFDTSYVLENRHS